MERKIRVALLMGSDREGRFCDVVARWAIDQINRRSEFTLDVIDPLEAALPTRIERQPSAEVQAYRERIGRADAFVLIVPEYNRGYPAALKSMIDHAKEEWYAKPIAMVSYGGMAGGLRSVEQLRLVFSELHAVTLRDTVSFHVAWKQFDRHGRPIHAEAVQAAMTTLLDRLKWWADALTKAREETLYMPAQAVAG